MRTYELMFVVDPRVSDEEVVTMAQDYRNMITAGGSTITGEENWGRRKLAYPIDKVNEGKYFLFYVESEVGKTALPEVEHRMRQNDKILRYLTVRTDEDLKRAASRRKSSGRPAGEAAGNDPSAAGAAGNASPTTPANTAPHSSPAGHAAAAEEH
jgi:small subunit ribosomal protein S6